MKTTVQKWGNSYAVRIPKSFIKELGLEYRTNVELTLEDGKLVIQPIKEETITLDDLLAQVIRAFATGVDAQCHVGIDRRALKVEPRTGGYFAALESRDLRPFGDILEEGIATVGRAALDFSGDFG